MNVLIALIRKDWQLFLADRRAVVLCFVVPILLASVFGLIFQRPGDGCSAKLPILLVAESEGAFTDGLLKDLQHSQRVSAEVTTRTDAEARIANHSAIVAVILPANIEQLSHWEYGKGIPKPQLQILCQPQNRDQGRWAEGVMTELLMKRIAEANDQDAAELTPWVMQQVDVTSPQSKFNSFSHSFGGMTLQYLLFWGMECGLIFLRDRRRALWLRMCSMPVSLSMQVFSKLISTSAIAAIIVATTFTFGWLAFDVKIQGSLLGFIVIAGLSCILASALGLLISTLGGTEARARSLCVLVILALSLLGGLWVPSFVFPEWARGLANAMPTSWAMRGLAGMTWQGLGVHSAMPSALALLGFTTVFLAVAMARLITSEARLRRGYT